MNEKKFNWDDLKAFLAVARKGGLSGATKEFSGSPATLGRRVQALESSLNIKLFERRADGYSLTRKGEELLSHAEAVEQNVFSIERWQDEHSSSRSVRISAGSWTTFFLMQRFSELYRKNDDFNLSFLATETRMDIHRRASDIGIRNARPTEIGLACKALNEIAFAVYRSENAQGALPWVTSSAQTPSAQWVKKNSQDERLLEVSHPRNALDLIERDLAKGVLPCFIGDVHPHLNRASDVISPLTHTQWLVMHEEDRFSGAIRSVLRRLEKILGEEKALFSGELA